jgi:hypothetical protein
MGTVSINLDTAQYVKVNIGLKPLTLQALNDSVRITLSSIQPAVENTVFHLLGGKDAPLQFPSIDTDVWALSITDKSSLIATETDSVPVSTTYENRHVVEDSVNGDVTHVMPWYTRLIILTAGITAENLLYKFDAAEDFATLEPGEQIIIEFRTLNVILNSAGSVPYRLQVFS